MAGAVEFVVTEADYVGAAKDAFVLWLRSRPGRRRIVFTTLFWAALGFALGWLDGGLAAAGLKCLLLGFGGLVFQAVVYGACYLRLPRRARRLYRQHSRLDAPVSIGWWEGGIRIESATADMRYAWSDLYQWADGRSAVLLYQNEQVYNFVPRRMLDAAAGAELSALLSAAGVPRA